MSTPLPDWLADPALSSLWARVRDRLERNGLVTTGQVRVRLTTREERHAVSALVGRSITKDVVTVDLAEIDARVRERWGHGGLIAMLEEMSSERLTDRVAQREASIAGRAEVLALARQLVDGPWVDDWVADLRRTGLLTRMSDAESVVRGAAEILARVFAETPDVGRARVELAAEVLGDAHALDEDRPVHRVVLRALAAAAGTAFPESVSERWALWESAGVSPDSVSSTCLTLGLRAGDHTLDPVHVTRWDLRRGRGITAPDVAVLVCENPRVLEAVAETHAGRVPVVCTSGEPNTVVTTVLKVLVDAGTELRYHGDFDWPGIAIANRMVSRFRAKPWRMAVVDYEAHLHPDAPRLRGAPVEPSWDPELGAVMRGRGRTLHEETMMNSLLTELNSWA